MNVEHVAATSQPYLFYRVTTISPVARFADDNLSRRFILVAVVTTIREIERRTIQSQVICAVPCHLLLMLLLLVNQHTAEMDN